MQTDSIRQKIQELCPDVATKRAWSKTPSDKKCYTEEHQIAWCGDCYACANCGNIFTTTGDELTLAVVLRAIAKTNPTNHIVCNYNGSFAEYKVAQGEMGLWTLGADIWDLTKDRWEDQTEETCAFIGSLLGI